MELHGITGRIHAINNVFPISAGRIAAFTETCADHLDLEAIELLFTGTISPNAEAVLSVSNYLTLSEGYLLNGDIEIDDLYGLYDGPYTAATPTAPKLVLILPMLIALDKQLAAGTDDAGQANGWYTFTDGHPALDVLISQTGYQIPKAPIMFNGQRVGFADTAEVAHWAETELEKYAANLKSAKVSTPTSQLHQALTTRFTKSRPDLI